MKISIFMFNGLICNDKEYENNSPPPSGALMTKKNSLSSLDQNKKINIFI